MSKRMSLGVLIALSCSVVACMAGSSEPTADETDSRARPIIGGSKATAYPEAILVDMYQNNQLSAYCSGSLIAPKVVLTAGHCVFQFTKWVIKAPFASNQTANASSGATYDWTNTSESVDPSMHDIGLIFLDTAITLPSYPTLSTGALANNSQVVNIGRINNGALSTTALYVSAPITVTSGSASGYKYDYSATDKIESGDSGGPDLIPGTHEIVSVNSGAGGSTEVLARVDLVGSWIQQQIAAHGGSGTSTGSSSSSSTGASASTGSGSSTGSGAGGSTGGSCSHADCTAGTKLVASCDPCVAEICAADSYCCSTKWDSQCVSEVKSICGQATCGGGTTSTGSGAGGSSSSSSGSGGSTSACGNVTFSGECVGNTVEWCDGTLQKLACGTGGTCGWNAAQGYYDCL